MGNAMKREAMLARVGEPGALATGAPVAYAPGSPATSRLWDIIVVGGGATGVGVAIDAATRGYGVLLLEQSDFGKGTSSRSTKLVHGGVRYLEQGNISLVMEEIG